jgi:hypothetical protein
MRLILPLLLLGLTVPASLKAQETVPLPAFRSVELRGGGAVVVVPGPVQRVTILEGSSSFTRFRMQRDSSLHIDVCNERCPQHYRLRVQIQSPYVPSLQVTGGGAITAANGFGPQRELAAAVTGGGRIDARAVSANELAAAVQGGGQIFVRSNGTLAASVNGGGEIRYWGHPMVSTAINGGGAVRPGS